MSPRKKFRLPKISVVKKHELRLILVIAVAWTLVDFILFILLYAIADTPSKYSSPDVNLFKEIILREANVFVISFIIGYFLVSTLRNFLRGYSLWYNLLIKTGLLVLFHS